VEWTLAVGVAVAGATVGAVIGAWLAIRWMKSRFPGRAVDAPGDVAAVAGVAGEVRRGIPRQPVAATGPAPTGLSGLGRRSLDSLRVGVVVLDAEDRPVLVNPAARALGLLRPRDGRDGAVVAHTIVRTLAGQVRGTGVRREVELDLPRSDGSGSAGDGSGSAGDESGSAGEDAVGVHLRAVALGGDHVAIEAVDVTDAHRVARVRRDFVANVSHELKTPIGALQLLSEALLDATSGGDGEADAEEWGRPGDAGQQDTAAARRFAERIQRESTRLGRLVTELIELTRLQGADPLPTLDPVSVDWIVAEVVDRSRTGASAKQTEVRFVGERGLLVYGSDSQLATAVANLVENAISYSPEGSRVTISARRDEETVEVAVVDEGFGIASKDLDRVFERFYRADKARSRATGGTGLGLAIVKHIATNHGGRVEVASTLGAGSTFTLRLPARPPDAVLPLPESVEIAASAIPKGST
jgi:two-component system sensor histidine kinase SenX3